MAHNRRTDDDHDPADPAESQHGEVRAGPAVSRRWLGRAVAIGAPTAVVLGIERTDASAASTTWDLAGNAATTPGPNFLGTTDARDLVFKTGAVERLRVTSTGLVGIGTTTPGGLLNATSSTQILVKGEFTGGSVLAGVRGSSTSTADGAAGVSGVLSPNGAVGNYSAGVLGTARPPTISSTGAGVIGHHGSNGIGVWGYAEGDGPSVGVLGHTFGVPGAGVHGTAQNAGGFGVIGEGQNRATGGSFTSATGTALYASGPTFAGSFDGPVAVRGTLSKSGGSFRIDHPDDPANRYLSHSLVEPPDMMNVYNGLATLNEAGTATVELPSWFESLNRDFRYQLTPIGAAAPNLHIATKVDNGQFTVAGDPPGLEVSGQVTGIRQDAWANANRIPVETDKAPDERNTYLHPELFG